MVEFNQKLFSYGTLQYESVQQASFGRKLKGKKDVLSGYELSQLMITDPEVLAKSGDAMHPIIYHTGKATDCVEGMVFDITTDELAQADAYEVDDYQRVEVKLASGTKAWAYVASVSKA